MELFQFKLGFPFAYILEFVFFNVESINHFEEERVECDRESDGEDPVNETAGYVESYSVVS